ncbi:protein LMBR1L-like isoform X2 [Gordionus sp. m RMFG-2023]|uniref:protein LMBR1L-like isoform X2 n=1 Tax=Gordionus sp. m RMFG-2023 TaxID=3053472 RepID=UPI0031FCD340
MSDEDDKETHFNNTVRENIVCLIFFIIFYLISSLILTLFWQNQDQGLSYSDLEDIFISKITFAITAFSLAICFASSLMLPISIISNEILIIYPDNEDLNWLNTSLIHSLWNYIFLLSNCCLFVLLPFAYFFAESIGFTGIRKGILNRLYETSIVSLLYYIMIVGISWLIFSTIQNEDTNIWTYYVPFSYHCISLFGVLTLLVCTPIGFTRIFDVIGDLVIKPKSFHDLEEERNLIQMEEIHLKQRMILAKNEKDHFKSDNESQIYVQIRSTVIICNGHHSNFNKKIINNPQHFPLYKNEYPTNKLTEGSYDEIRTKIQDLDSSIRASFWKRNVNYPFFVLFLFILTALSVVIVGVHCLELLVDEKALPSFSKHINIGNTSLSFIGPLGGFLDVIIIFYLKIASFIGFVGLPCFARIKPKLKGTSLTKIILNCGIFLILTSAFPVFSRTIGITKFDLIGNLGKLQWLGNFYLVLFYNLVFVLATAWCLTNKFTRAMKLELYNRFLSFVPYPLPTFSSCNVHSLILFASAKIIKFRIITHLN